MKILYIHQYYNTPEMSGSIRSYEFAKRLAKDGHDVTIITSNRDPNSSKYIIEQNDFKVVWLKTFYSNKMNFFFRLIAFFSFMLKACIEITRHDYELVFATSTPLTVFVPGWFASKLKRAPLVFEVRDLWPEMPIAAGILKNKLLILFLRWFEKVAYRSSKAVIALSEDMKTSIEKVVPSAKVHCIPNSSDIELFDRVSEQSIVNFRSSINLEPDDLLLVYAGTLGYLNNVSYLLDVVEALDVNQLKFAIIGSGVDADKLKERIDKSNLLKNRVHFFGRVSKIRAAEIVRSADFGISLFRPIVEMEKNSANKFFDYLSSGLPIVLNYGGWQEQLITSKNCGFRVASDPSIAAIELKNKILTDPNWRIKAGQSSRKLAEEYFARDLLYQRLVDVFMSVAIK